MADLEKRILSSAQLPTLPAVAIRLLELSRKPDSQLSDVVNIIKADSAIASKVLRTANSSFFGTQGKVATIDRAVALLGSTVITSLALGFSLVNSSMGTGTLANHYRAYWQQSLLQAVAAKLVASLACKSRAGECFLAGLLADIGRLAMLRTIPGEYSAVLSQANETGEDLLTAETEALGTNHVEIGIELMRRWRLPIGISESARFHHASLKTLLNQRNHPEFDIIRTVAAASAVGEVLRREGERPAVSRLAKLTKELFRTPDGYSEQLFVQSTAQAVEMSSLFSINPTSFRTAVELMAQANEQLSQLVVREHMKSVKASAQSKDITREKRELESAHQNLKNRATKDPLTGIANRQFFDEVLNKDLSRCARTGSTVGVIFCDIDRFKSINDQFGHLFGDRVLKAVAGAISSVLRESDLVARYGGEEFVVAVIAPTHDVLAQVAERIRDRVESTKILHEETRVPVTLSVGTAIALPRRVDQAFGSKLIDAADRAMYDSKRSGRNQVHHRSLLNEAEQRLVDKTVLRRFSRWLVSHKVIDPAKAHSVLNGRNTRQVRLGDLGEKFGYLNPEALKRIVDAQAIFDLRFGEVAMEMGILSEDQVAQLLACQQEDPDEACAQLVRAGLVDRKHASALLDAYLGECRKIDKPRGTSRPMPAGVPSSGNQSS